MFTLQKRPDGNAPFVIPAVGDQLSAVTHLALEERADSRKLTARRFAAT